MTIEFSKWISGLVRLEENTFRAQRGMKPVNQETAEVLKRLRQKYPGEEDAGWLESMAEMAVEDRELDEIAKRIGQRRAQASNN